jgi:hypothetical protein
MPGHGSDYSMEERQLRTRDEKEGVEQWVESVFFAVGEVTFLGLPAFYGLMDAEPNVSLKFAALFSWLALVVCVGSFGGPWLDVDWPPVTPLLLLLRLLYYNVVIAAVAYVGAAIDLSLHSPAVTATVAVLLAVGSALVFPRLARAVDAR